MYYKLVIYRNSNMKSYFYVNEYSSESLNGLQTYSVTKGLTHILIYD